MRITRIWQRFGKRTARKRGHCCGPRLRNRLDAAGAGLLGAALALLLAVVVPGAQAGKTNSTNAKNSEYNLPASFKGKLPITQLTEDEAILHALDRLAYGPRPGEVERVRRMGLEAWINQQLNYKSIDDSAVDSRLAEFKTLRMSPADLLAKYPPLFQAAKREGLSPDAYRKQYVQEMKTKRQELHQQGIDPAMIQFETMPGPQRIQAELDLATVDRAIYSHRQLYEVMCNFWFNHFNVNANKGADHWFVTSYVQNTIRPHAMGKFENLLLATAESPAMLFYLDNWLSADPVAFQHMQQEMMQRRMRIQGLTEGKRLSPKQLERGLNENYGREIMELHTLGVDTGYTQQDVIEVAKCLTGWTIRAPRRDPEFFFNDRIHAAGPKYVLGKTIDYGGMADGEAVIHMLATNPATAHHISFELARHFVSDNPPEALVDRMAQTFLASDGDTRAVLKTMIYSPEFWSRQAFRAKVKTPFELAVSATRAIGAQTTVSPQLAQWVARMGEPLYQCEPPTGYADTAVVWVNAGALLNRMNFALALATNHMPGVDVNLPELFGQDAESNPELVLSRALDDFLDGQVSAHTRDALEKQLSGPQVVPARFNGRGGNVNEGLIAGLVLGAPEFQRR